MAVSTRETLSGAMICVAKRIAIRTRVGTRGPVCLLLVTDSARRHLATRVGFTLGRVTRVAIAVCRKVRGNRQARAAIHRRVVTTGAASLRASCTSVVLCVIEFHVEALVEARGEILERRIVAGDIRVADNAHRYRRRCELSAMTVSAGFVAWETGGCGIVGSLMTGVACERAVSLACVKELRVIDLWTLSPQEHKKDTQREFDHLMSLRFNGGRSAIR